MNARQQGRQTKERILDVALRTATRTGLSSLTFGSLAEASGISKSGLFAHFGSRDGLHQAVVHVARERFFAAVCPTPTPHDAPAILALRAMIRRYVGYSAGLLVDDGAFLASVVHEAEALAEDTRSDVRKFAAEWSERVRSGMEAALAAGHLVEEVDAGTFVFAVLGFGLATPYVASLDLDRQRAHARALRDVDVMLSSLATERGARLIEEARSAEGDSGPLLIRR